jgi:hypothetical protein
MCDGFLNETNKGGCPDARCPYYLKGKARTFVNLREKKRWASRLKAFKTKIFKT